MKTWVLVVFLLFAIPASVGDERYLPDSLSIYIGSLYSFVSILNVRESFNFNNSTQAYELKSTFSNVYGLVKGRGHLHEIDEIIDQVNTDVVGQAFKGYSRLSLSNKSSGLFIRHQVLVKDIIKEVEIDASMNVEAEVEITSGSLADFAQGQTMQISFTEAGLKTYVDALSVILIGILKQVFVHRIKLELPWVAPTLRPRIKDIVLPENIDMRVSQEKFDLNVSGFKTITIFRVNAGI